MHPLPDFKRGGQLTSVRVLLLEDDATFADLVRSNLERVDWGGLSIECVATLRDARAHLERGGIDLVITDLNLPDSKGLDTLVSLLKATDRLILVLTGELDAGLREPALQLGAYDLMSKDRLDRTELERLVRLAAMQAHTFRSLRDSEERFRGLTELSTDWYWQQDAELRFVATGGATDARGGITPEAHVGKLRWELPSTEILNQTWDEHKAVLKTRQSFHDLMLRRLGTDGEARYISVSGRPIFDAQGAFCGYRGAAKDVTRRVRMDLRLAIEHSVTRLLGESQSIAEAVPQIIRVVCGTLGWACGARFEHDEQNQAMRCAETWGVASAGIDEFLEASRQRSAPLAQPGGLIRRAWVEGKPTWIRDVTQEASFRRAPEAAKAGLHSAFAFPIKVGAQAIGVMEFFSRQIHHPDAELLECMTYVGSQIGQFMQRKRGEEDVRRNSVRLAEIIALQARLAAEKLDVRAISDLLVEKAREIIGTGDAAIQFVEGNRFVYYAASEGARHHVGVHLALEGNFSGAIVQSGKAIGCEETQTDSRIDPVAAKRSGTRSLIGAPLQHEGRVIGVLTLLSPQPHAFDAEQLRALALLAGIAGSAIQRARSETLLKLEHTVTRALADADSTAAGLVAAIRSVCETEGWECGRYLYADDKAGLMRLGAAWGVPVPEIERFLTGSRDVTYAPGVGLVGKVWQSGQPLWVADVDKDSRTLQKSAVRDMGLHGAIFFPILSGGKTIGVLAFNCREVREPEERLLQTARVIGSQIGQFVQRKQAEEIVRESEARLRSLNELSSDWYWEQDSEFRLTFMSRPLGEKTGLDPSTYLGRKRWDQPALNLTEADWARHRAQLERHEPFRDFEMERLGEGGRRVWLALGGEPVFDEAGGFAGYRGVGKDITQRKRTDQLQALEQAVTRRLSEANNASEALKAAIRAICETERWECGRYFGADEKAGVLRFVDSWGVAEPEIQQFMERSREITFQPGVGLMGRVWQSGQPLWIADVTKDKRAQRSAFSGDLGIRGGFVFPVKSEGRTIGVFGFSSREIREPEERLLQTIHQIGSQIGQFLQLKLAEEVLRESEARFRSLAGLSSDWYWEQDENFLFTMVSSAAKDATGRGPLANIGKTRWALPALNMTEADWAAHRGLLEARQPFYDLELHRRTPEGKSKYTCISGEPVFDAAGAFKGYRGVGKDITERKQAEERQATHTRYQEKIASFGTSALGKREAVDLVEDALQAVIEALPTTAVAYIEPDAGERELVMRGAAGLAAGEPATVARYASADAIALVLERGEPVVIERPAGGAVLPFEWAARFRCAALVPVHGDNRVQGVLCVLSEGEGAFASEESKFLVTAAAVLSAGLRRIDSEARLAFLAQFDALTGLPNRALLADRFSQMIVQARRHEKPLGVLFIDLDDFKLVNDSLGHAGGDELLKETARRLQGSVRAGDTVARISGDEFAVILGDLARPDDAALVAQKIIDRLAAPVQARGQEVFVTASIGIAAFPTDGDDAETLLGAADAAMYRAKQAGRNAYQFFTAEINQRTRARAQLGSELRHALERGEFALAYQPKFDLRSGRPCAVEALLRWRHPERGLVPPVEFIPVLEETGLIVQVGEWVLQRACEDIKAWQAAGLPPMQVAVNLSARQFRQQDLDVRIRELISAAGVAPGLIELEITESQLMQDPDHAKRVIQTLSDNGIGVAIDDFGTGYSSLSYLTRFPVAALKIDRSFVADVLSDRAAAAIVRTIIDMAHTLGFIVIAEGVETEAQALLLGGLGCEQAQGYYFARPMPEAEFRTLISSYGPGLARQQVRGKR